MAKSENLEKKLDALFIRVDRLENENNELRRENTVLKERLARHAIPKNSKNSSKPPSSDYPKIAKTKSLRKASGKKAGGQLGHKGTTLKMVDSPSIIEKHTPNFCTCCGSDLADISGEFAGKRQVIDIPPIQPVVTEHRIFNKKCTCGNVNNGNYPEGIVTPISYGGNVQALAMYMHARQYMPYERLREFFNTIFNLPISTGGINYLIQKYTNKALPFYNQIREKVQVNKAIGADETGANINGKLHWAWVFQNTHATFLSIHQKRGYQAIEEIMPKGFKDNILITDCWKSYFKTNAANHQLCTAHLLRELEYFTQKYKNDSWSANMKKLIMDALDLHKKEESTDDEKEIIFSTFNGLLEADIDPKKKDLVTFKKRMVKYVGYVFLFLKEQHIPPDNNASERAVRNFKVKQKVSGFFKSIEGADSYAILRSIIDTAIKNAQNPFEVLYAIFKAKAITE